MKKTLAILLALVLCFSAFALIACNKCEHNFVDGVCTKCGKKDPDYKPDQGGNADVPVAEGKVTLYFTMADDSVELPAYASVYYAGGLTTWAEKLEAPAFTRLNDTKVYYIQIAYDAEKEQANQYSLVLGYNEASQLPADKLGLIWNDNYKSDTCKEFAYGSNAEFEYTAGAQKINLGIHKFSTPIDPPERISKVTLRVTFAEALGENAEVYFMGSFSDWDATKGKATANADRTMYSLELKDVLCTNYLYKILVIEDATQEIVKKDGAGKDLAIWDWTIKDATVDHADADAESKLAAYIEIGAGKENLPVDIKKYNNNSYVDLAGSVSEAQLDKDGNVEVPVTGIDLSKAKLVEGEKTVVNEETGKEEIVGNNIFTKKYEVSAEKTFVIEFKDALPATVDVYMLGSMNGWNDAYAAGKAKFTISEDRKTARLTLNVLPGNYEANILAIHKDIAIAGGQTLYDAGTKINADGNLKLTVSGFDKSDVALFADAQAVPEVKDPEYAESVNFTVKFKSAVPAGKHIFLVGSLNGWPNDSSAADVQAAAEMTSTDRINWTITLTHQLVGPKDFLVLVCNDATINYGTKIGKDGVYGGANGSVTVAKDSTTIALFGDTEVDAPAADVTVTLTLTFAESMEGKAVVMKGGMTGWKDVVMTTTDNLTYTVQVTAAAGASEFIVGIGATEEAAKTYAIKLAGTGEYGEVANAKVTIPAEGGSVQLFGKTVAVPAA